MKSRVNWVMKGERNTPYFHRAVVIKRKVNRILSIRTGVGEEIVDSARITEDIYIHFHDFVLFGTVSLCSSKV